MRTSEKTAVLTNRARLDDDIARVDTRTGGLRKVTDQTASIAGSPPRTEVAPQVPDDAEYFVHPFVD